MMCCVSVLLLRSIAGRREDRMRAMRNQLLLGQCSAVRLGALAAGLARLASALGRRGHETSVVLRWGGRRALVRVVTLVDVVTHDLAVVLMI